jgi:hypothetical protein
MMVMSAVFSALLGLIFGGIFGFYKQQWQWRHVRNIVNFGNGDVIFVLPHREHPPDSIVPRVAGEDVHAMMNVIYLVTRAGLPLKFKIRDTSNLSDEDKKRNIVTIGGTEANEYTNWVLNKANVAVRFERDDSGKSFVLKRGATTTYTSPSHLVPPEASTEVAREDVALLCKLRNPMNPSGDTIVVVVAGLRGIGTWAAADCLRKKYHEIYSRKRKGRHFSKSGDFIMVLSAAYEKFDIRDTRIIDFEDIA